PWQDGPVTRCIAYQGEPGSNSDIVCREHYPDWDTLACASFEDVFAAVAGDQAQLALLPIDNSLAGRVSDIHHFLPHSGLHIIAEHFLRIKFMLMGVPGSSLDSVTTVRSHVHALGQCRSIIREHHLNPIVAGDTAGAAREAAESDDPLPPVRRARRPHPPVPPPVPGRRDSRADHPGL